jgi:hypothetical protein
MKGDTSHKTERVGTRGEVTPGMVRAPKAKDMTRDDQKTLPAAATQRRPAAVARSMRQAHRHVLQALRNTGLESVRVKALVTGIGR